MTRLASLFPAACCAALAFLAAPLGAVQIVAHRGASYDAPENTLAAEKLAWAQQADVVETDIYLTKDGKIIAIHDGTYKRTTGKNAKIASLTQAEARSLDAGSWKGAQFAGEKLPTLEEQIGLIPVGKRLFVEIKVGAELVSELARVLAATGADERNITIISFNYDALREVRKRLPKLPTQYLVGYKSPDQQKPGAKRQPTLDEVIAQATAAGLTGLDLQSTWPLTSDDVRKIRAAGLQLHVWTIDDVDIAKRWKALGADSITTNRPGWLREQLQK